MATQDRFHRALGIMGIEDPKPLKSTIDTIKMPPMDQPDWFKDTIADMMQQDPPFVGPQVPHLPITGSVVS